MKQEQIDAVKATAKASAAAHADTDLLAVRAQWTGDDQVSAIMRLAFKHEARRRGIAFVRSVRATSC
jgi:hypothetical protein